MTEQQTFKIENVGGIVRAELILKPGMNVLAGRNGAGKTSAMRAIVRAQGGGGELERRDGAERGVVEGPGVKLTVGKVVRTTGQAELSLAEATPLANLIDPGLKDTEAAARARIRALIELIRVPVDDAALDALSQGDAGLREWLAQIVQEEAIDDLLLASEKLRGQAHSRARQAESAAEQADGEAQAAGRQAFDSLESLGGKDGLIDLTPEAARTALIEGARQYERLEAQCEAREKLEERQVALRSTIGDRPDWEEGEKDLQGGEAFLAAGLEELRRIEAKIAGTRQRIEGLRVAAKKARADADRWDRAQEILGQKAEGPTRAELDTSRHEMIVRSEERLRLAGASHAYRTSIAAQVEAQSRLTAAGVEAARLRELAAEIPQVLGSLLADAGAEGMTVVDGRLCALVDGKPVDWERRLSDGQRIRRALDLFARVNGERSIAPVDDSFWLRLDPQNRLEFAQMCFDRGLCGLTEQPADGDLRVEHSPREG